MSTLLRAENVNCSRELRANGCSRVSGVSMSIEPGTITLLRGSEGCGKNLLLRVLGLLERPDDGELFLHDAPTREIDESTRLGLRNRHFGFVFAEPFLLGTFSVLENVAMPLFKIAGVNIEEARLQTARLLDFFGLAGVAEMPGESLALLDQYKASLARALVHEPEMLLIEDIDAQLSGAELHAFLNEVARARDEFSATVILSATNLPDLLLPHRRIELSEGEIALDSQPSAPIT